jgi:diaminopimelate epimerase
VKISGGEVRGLGVSMGNPHYVMVVPEFPADWRARSVEIQSSGHFPQGVNVVWVKHINKREVRVLFFERGAGETQSSGTGSCSAAVVGMSLGLTESTVTVHGPGGTQTVRREGKRIFLRGPARIVCQGEFFLS